jgi:hypothetical protein
MHKCLLIYEILICICRSALQDTKQGRNSLCALAQTSSKFDSVLDILWEKLDSLAPLLLTFPSDLFHFEGELQLSSMTVVSARKIIRIIGRLLIMFSSLVKGLSFGVTGRDSIFMPLASNKSQACVHGPHISILVFFKRWSCIGHHKHCCPMFTV